MNTDISKYSSIINKLAGRAGHPSFNNLFNEYTDKLESDKRFLVKMEIQRLARPCIRSIDLRDKVSEPCLLYEFDGIKHYFNEHAIQEFERSVDTYGQYTFGVYEHIIKLEHEDLVEESADSIELSGNDDIPADIAKYNADIVRFLDYPLRSKERMNFAIHIEVFIAQSKSVIATSVDISERGLKFKIKPTDEPVSLSIDQLITIHFRDLAQEYKLDPQGEEYEIVAIDDSSEQIVVRCARPSYYKAKAFDDFLANLIKGNKRRYKVNLDNVITAVSQKSLEQAFAKNTMTLPIALSDDNERGHAHFACINGVNKEVLDYWVDESGEQRIAYMLNRARLQKMTATKIDTTLVYVFNHINDEKVYFYSATTQELEDNKTLRDVFFSFGSRKVSWRVYKLTISPINPYDAFTPTSLPDGVSDSVRRQNKPLSPRLMAHMQFVNKLAMIEDITSEEGQECYQQFKLTRHSIKELKIFAHPRNKPPVNVQTFRYQNMDQRKETRYKLRTTIRFAAGTNTIYGVTEDFSVSGLRIELDEPFLGRRHTQVAISLPSLQKITKKFTLNNLIYRIKKVQADGHIIHLETLSGEGEHEAEVFFDHLIANNKDKLKTDRNEESIPGMGHALRCLHSKNMRSVAFYLEKKNAGYAAKAIVKNSQSNKVEKLLAQSSTTGKANLAWLFQDKLKEDAFISNAIRYMHLNQSVVESEIFVTINRHQSDIGQEIEAKWLHELPTQLMKQNFIRQALADGHFIALKVVLAPPHKPELNTFETEMKYLSHYAIHKARALDDSIWNLSAFGQMIDITDEVITRHRFLLT